MMMMLLMMMMMMWIQTSPQEQPPHPSAFCYVTRKEEVLGVCTSCAAAAASSCPPGMIYDRTAPCRFLLLSGGRDMEVGGCQRVCERISMERQCCFNHGGPLCLPCPRWAGNVCNSHGDCLDGDHGNGTCICNEKFSGFACQECKNPNAFGANCDQECDCLHGVCNKGPDGDGQCWCQAPYTGRRCDQVSSSCRTCPPYSYCKGLGDAAVCQCLPGFTMTTANTCQRTCSESDCEVNAQCTSDGSKVTCTCKPQYVSVGGVCLPRNPCSENNGGCPVESTVCVFTGPDQSSCRCKPGLSPGVGGAQSGCHLVSSCSADSCHQSATCQTGSDGRPMCVCDSGQIPDGWRCYGNLMEQLMELDRSGNHQGNLTGAITLFNKGCSLLLNHDGPFTAFIPLLRTPLTGVDEVAVCKNHLILGEHLYEDLSGRDMNLYGGGVLRTKDHQRFILMDNPSHPYTVLQQNLPAANGVIHIIDRPIISPFVQRPSVDERFADKTIGEILRMDEKFNRMLSLVDNCGAPPPLKGPGPMTVFIPTNQAVDAARDGSILYMLTDAKPKLQELLRHHVFSQAVLTVDELAVHPQIHTMAKQVISVRVEDDGQIVLGEKGVHITGPSVTASNGIIHMIDGFLYPPSILPILPHRCDVIENKITVGPCVHCSYLYETSCPEGSTEMESHLIGCDYVASEREHVGSKGCAKYCNTTKKVSECCKGFYGPDCKPCIGGFQHPCYDKGSCLDGIHGNGSCSCHPGFEGIACHICSNPMKHGSNCDQDCRCVHGECDNRPGSDGVCRRGSCKEGYSGENCDRTATPCNSDGLTEHCHVNAYCTQTELHTTCVCSDGFHGDGLSCSVFNPCLLNHRGGCDVNAECVFAGPNNVSCVCSEGWSGDGAVCVEVNNCHLDARGGCSVNADCIHIGPAQSECVCKTGYMGDGTVCDLINPCLTNNGGCHDLATCELNVGGTHTCTCPDGYAGNGNICYGSVLEELDMNIKLYSFYRLIQRDSLSTEDLSGNVTVLAPSSAALRNMTPDQNLFWTSRHHLGHFLRAHVLSGVHSVEDLERLVGTRVPTLNPPTRWEISNSSGVIQVGPAPIVSHNLPAINGYIHIIDQILAPPLSDVPPEPPNLADFLNSTSNFTLFRRFALMFNLSGDLGGSEFTLLLPTDQAVRDHLSTNRSSVLDPDTFKYHVIVGDLLFPDHLSDGTVKSTLLGTDYQVQFHLNDQNQTLVNDVPLDGSFTETQYGVILVLNQVLQVRRNRCSKPVTLQVNGRCSDCDGPPRCLFNYKPIRSQFPVNMKSNCRYRKRVRSRRKSVPGCVIKCLRITMDHSCCRGYYGHECFKCPGDEGNWCSGHGECRDGNQGDGECRCYEGFHGTACEDCEPGRYGLNCTAECVCDHGKCEDGLEGSGRCVCYKGWRGASCSVEIVDDACGGVCHKNANCITGPQGAAAACVCVAGYKGNGTHCQELDLCSRFNGGCSPVSTCVMVSAGLRTCTCNRGYSGDGVFCLEMDGCLVNNGGCHRSAECIRTGPNTTSCRCRDGFQGSGRFCSPVNPCRKNNGGCHKSALCTYHGDGRRNCTCRRGYIGDGLDCRGNTYTELYHKPDNAYFKMMIVTSTLRGIYGNGPFTAFSPVEQTNGYATISQWQSSGRLHDLLFYHIVACETLTLNDLKTTQRAIATSGHTLYFTQDQGSVWINNQSQIVASDYVTSDGVIHHIKSVLTPYELKDKPKIDGKTMNVSSAAAAFGYSRFFKLIEDSGLVPLLQLSIHQPFTMFWPSDRVLDSLPPERQRWLSSPDHQRELVATVKAHIIRNIKLMTIAQPDKHTEMYRTMHGSSIKYRCDRNVVGQVLVNDNEARLVERYLMFKEGVAYGIDQLLEPPGLGAHCDGMENKTTYGRCGYCPRPPPCPFRYMDTKLTEQCHRFRSRYMGSSFGIYDPYLRDCRRVCLYPTWTPQCCKNHYGRDCQVCPGGVESPCGNHGNCDDGFRGRGRCSCERGFTGTACEQCQSGFYGPNCTACQCVMGSCDDGSEGSGQCVCKQGWIGDRCQTELGSIPEECRQCHPQASCLPSVGCQCKSGFQGNGTVCTPEPPPDLCSEYNGGCHLNADCNQTGLIVNCTCRPGYQGDGISCEPINRCVTETNGGCSDYATCTFTGPNERDCECLPGYVGNGVQCMEKVVPPVDRCLEDNGGCDRVAVCRDLHYHVSHAGVFHLRSSAGKYKLNFSQADAACQAEGAALATFKQMGDAQQLGMHLCVAGWMDGAKVGYPTRFPSDKCGLGHVGIVLYKDPVDQSSTYDAYCHRIRDVSCSCPDGYVGDGDFCNGVVVDVLATSSNFTRFYKFLVQYSSVSSDGKQLMDVLSHKSSDVTLFVPHDDGFTSNQTLSGRDLQYHISTNHSRRLFNDLKHQEVIKSRLGFNLTVTHGNNQSCKLVNQRLLVDWDIPAVNGIIHVIEAPLAAPPPLISPHASTGSAHSSAGVWAVMVCVLLVCVLSGLGFYVYKHKPDGFRFNYFRNEDEGSEGGLRALRGVLGVQGVRPALVSIPNPLYSGSRSFTDPFGDPGLEVDPSDPQDPPQNLDPSLDQHHD